MLEIVKHRNLKIKRLDNRQKIFLIVGFLLFALCILCCKKWLDYQKDVVSRMQTEYSSDDFTSINGYQMQNDVYMMIGDDPSIVLRGKPFDADTLKISFKSPLESDMNLQVFYHKKGDGWSEENSVISNLAKGTDETVVDIVKGKYEEIRIDLNGNFVLDYISLCGHNNKSIPFWYILVVCLLNIYLVVFWLFCLIKRNGIFRIVNKIFDKAASNYISANIKVYDLGTKYSIRLEKVFIILGLMLGMTYSVLIPPGQVPDEPTHVYYMSTSLGYGDKVYSEVTEYLQNIKFYDMVWNPAVKQNKDRIKETMGIKFSAKARKIVQLPSISFIRYFPANIGFVVSVSMNLPIYFCLQIAEFCSVIFYALCGYLALKRIPILKGALFTVLILPMTLQQCTSINYDVMVLSGSFYLFSYFIWCMTEKEKVGWKELSVLLMWGGILASIKPPYIFLLILFFAIHKDKVELPVGRRDIYMYAYKYRHVIGLAFFLAICIYIPYSEYDNLFKAVILNIPHTIDVFANTFSTLWDHYLISLIGKFGWLIYPMSNEFEIYTYILLALVALCSARYKNDSAIFARILCGISIIFGGMFVFLAMVGWTFQYVTKDVIDSFKKYQEVYSQMDCILGVQGRYFIPFIPLLMYSMHGIMKFSRREHILTIITAYTVWIVWPLLSIASMFWEFL